MNLGRNREWAMEKVKQNAASRNAIRFMFRYAGTYWQSNTPPATMAGEWELITPEGDVSSWNRETWKQRQAELAQKET